MDKKNVRCLAVSPVGVDLNWFVHLVSFLLVYVKTAFPPLFAHQDCSWHLGLKQNLCIFLLTVHICFFTHTQIPIVHLERKESP